MKLTECEQVRLDGPHCPAFSFLLFTVDKIDYEMFLSYIGSLVSGASEGQSCQAAEADRGAMEASKERGQAQNAPARSHLRPDATPPPTAGRSR